jgi:hypothetical protein
MENIVIKNYRDTSFVISTVLVLNTFTFLDFFFYNPFALGFTALAVAQAVSLAGWVLLIVAPPLLLTLRPTGVAASSLFLAAALAWPVAVIAIRIVLLFQQGDVSVMYLFNFPIFIFTDIIAPIIYVLMWRSISRTTRSSKAGRRSASIVTKENALQP